MDLQFRPLRRGGPLPQRGSRPAAVKSDWRTTATTLAGIVSVLLVAAGLFYTNEANRQQQRLAVQGQVADRFSAAIDHLGEEDQPHDDKLSIRLGGIYALQRLMTDSPTDEATVVQVLCAFVRSHARRPAKLSKAVPSSPIDVRAAVTVLAYRPAPDNYTLDFSDTLLGLEHAKLNGADLRGVDLTHADLRDADLTNAKLSSTMLKDSDLSWASLGGADLTRAVLATAHLRGAYMEGANLNDANAEGADLYRADVAEASLHGTTMEAANLRGADLGGVDMRPVIQNGNTMVFGTILVNADLRDADLRGAKLSGAPLTIGSPVAIVFKGAPDFHGTDLRGADLSGTDLSGTDLDSEGFTSTTIDQNTRFPKDIEPPKPRSS